MRRNRRRSLFLFIIVLSLMSAAGLRPADAEDRFIEGKIAAAKAGNLSAQELSNALISEAQQGALSRAEIHEAFTEIPKLSAVVLQDLSDSLKNFLLKHDTSQAESLRQLLAELYTLQPTATLKLNQMMDSAETADELAEKGNAAELLRLTAEAQTPAEKQIFGSRLSKLPEQTAAALEASPDPNTALKTLGAAGTGFPPATMNELADKIVTKLADQQRAGTFNMNAWSFDDPAVAAVLKSAAAAKPELRAKLAPLYEARIHYLLETDDAKGMMEAYSGLLESRPDPDEANNQIRFDIVYGAESEPVRQFALGRLQELKYANRLSKLDQIRIMLHGYYGTNVTIFFVLSAGVILLLGGLMVVRPLFISSVTDAIAKSEARSAAAAAAAAERERAIHAKRPSVQVRDRQSDEKTKKIRRPLIQSGKQVSGYMKGPAEDDEYSRLLSFFDLDDTATDAEIKKAYRERVKSLHPDANPGEVRTQDEEFIELKEVYDRILEIRGSWFGGKR